MFLAIFQHPALYTSMFSSIHNIIELFLLYLTLTRSRISWYFFLLLQNKQDTWFLYISHPHQSGFNYGACWWESPSSSLQGSQCSLQCWSYRSGIPHLCNELSEVNSISLSRYPCSALWSTNGAAIGTVLAVSVSQYFGQVAFRRAVNGLGLAIVIPGLQSFIVGTVITGFDTC